MLALGFIGIGPQNDGFPGGFLGFIGIEPPKKDGVPGGFPVKTTDKGKKKTDPLPKVLGLVFVLTILLADSLDCVANPLRK